MARTKQQQTYIYEWALGNKNYVYYRYGIPYVCNDGVVCMTSVKEGKFKFSGSWNDAENNVMLILKSKKPNAILYEYNEYVDLIKKELNK
jgi:hypothetical protein